MIVRSCTPGSKSTVAAAWRASWSRSAASSPRQTPTATADLHLINKRLKLLRKAWAAGLGLTPSRRGAVGGEGFSQGLLDRCGVHA